MRCVSAASLIPQCGLIPRCGCAGGKLHRKFEIQIVTIVYFQRSERAIRSRFHFESGGRQSLSHLRTSRRVLSSARGVCGPGRGRRSRRATSVVSRSHPRPAGSMRRALYRVSGHGRTASDASHRLTKIAWSLLRVALTRDTDRTVYYKFRSGFGATDQTSGMKT